MPDKDVIPRSVRGSWRPAYRALSSGRAAADVGRFVTKAVVSAVRRGGGMPWVPTLSAGLERSIATGCRLPWDEARGQALRAAGGNPALRIALEEGEAILANPSLEGIATDAETALVTRTLERTITARVLAPARGGLVDKLGGVDSEQSYERAVIASVPIDEIAARVLRHPDGTGLRAPVAHRKQSTADLLDEPID